MKSLLLKAAAGFFGAVVIDAHGWLSASKSAGQLVPFDFKLAAIRWVLGAVTAVGASLGIDATNLNS